MGQGTSATLMMKTEMETIAAAGGQLPLGDIIKAVESALPFNDWDKAVYESSGLPRWQVRMRWHSSGFVKAGLIKKSSGVWTLTDEGAKAIKLPVDVLRDMVAEKYDAWLKEHKREGNKSVVDEDESGDAAHQPLMLELAQAQSRNEIENYIKALDPYDFQQLVAALLHGMGYTTPFVAAKGPDGGTDIIAYRDPFGATSPHIRVQVKHKPDSKTPPDDVRALRGVMRDKDEIGLFVATGGFTAEAMREAYRGAAHIELIDLRRFHELWIEHYDKMPEADRSLMPLRKVYFLIPDE
jgi:restriction system protein